MNDAPAVELTAQDEADLAGLGIPLEGEEKKPYRTVLETWKEVLSNIEVSRNNKIPAKVALKIIGSWPELTYATLQDYHELYHQFLLIQRDGFEEVLATDKKAFKRADATEDAEKNRKLYLELMYRWQANGIAWEHQWSASDADAAVRIAAIEDAMNFFLGEKGLIPHLGSIPFTYTDKDAEELGERLQEFKEGL